MSADAVERGLLRLLGVDPRRTQALARGLARATHGRMELLQERRDSGIAIDALRILLGVLLGGFSIGLAALVVLLRSQPQAACVLVAAVACAAGSITAVSLAPLALLQDDDAVALGWWPLTRREAAVARLLTLLRPALEVTAVLTALPLLALVAFGPVPVLSALLLALALALQATTIVTLVTAVVVGAVRLLGARRARAALGLLAFVLLAAFLVLPHLLAGEGRAAPSLGVVMAALPPSWFAAWADPLAWPLEALLALAVSLLAAPLALRLLSGRSAGAVRETPRSASRREPLVALAERLMIARGSEAHAMRLLVRAHLREDWRFAVVRFVPVLAIGACAVVAFLPDASPLARPLTAILPLRPALTLAIAAPFLGLAAGLSTLGSDRPLASFVLAASPARPGATLAAARAAARGIFLLPLLAVLVTIGIRAATPAATIALDLAATSLLFEIPLALIQWRHLAWPFSKARGGPPDEVTLGLGVGATPVSLMLAMALAWGYDRHVVTRLAACVLLSLALRALRRIVRRDAETRGLTLELAPVG